MKYRLANPKKMVWATIASMMAFTTLMQRRFIYGWKVAHHLALDGVRDRNNYDPVLNDIPRNDKTSGFHAGLYPGGERELQEKLELDRKKEADAAT